MGFNEMTHAFLAAKYYVRLTECFGERGKAAFLHAARYYAEQRGRRMAQRAIRDGKDLTYETYCQYGEWISTNEVKALGFANRTEVKTVSPDYEMHIHVCPWHEQFKKMGLTEAGLVYCSDLDASICRGFNPELVYEVSQTLHDHAFCIQTVRNAGLAEGFRLEKNSSGLRSFEYHCAHLYWAFYEVATAIFGEEGEAAAEGVLEDFEEAYGKEAGACLKGYQDTNFNVA
ncbi:MAG: L-2-amino-thiazoline-4-carboxylic acid hydrolase [Lachnospiraceae bacterium]|nr:L-2-amino-thiazoline-4-carboxylic acid hydrolase [Lachnospiraceae bacterium]